MARARGIRGCRLRLRHGSLVEQSGRPVGRHAEIGRAVAQEDQHERHHHERTGGADEGGGAPSDALGHRRDDRQERELAGGAARREDADHQPAVLHEPGRRDRRREHQGHRARAEADEQAPGEEQLPGRGHEHAEAGPGRDQQKGDGGDAADAEPLHQRRSERRGQSEEQQVDRDCEREHAHVPAELLAQRQHQHAGGGAEPGRSYQGQERDRRHDPGGVEREATGAGGRAHHSSMYGGALPRRRGTAKFFTG